MKCATLFAGLAAVSSVLALPEQRSCLTYSQANTIVAKYQSVLEGADYQGQSPNVTAKQVVAASYTEYSDSILSLEDVPLGSSPSATSRQQWLSEVLQHPDSGIQTLDIIYNCDKIVWHWLFPNVGSGQYEVKGFNLLTISKGKIVQADIEFNSIAWGLDTQQLFEYCPTGSSSNTTSS